MVAWKCPKCGAGVGTHGKGECVALQGVLCCGLVCECPDEDPGPSHGVSLSDPCTGAYCGHCEWSGTVPVKPKGLQAWEKKAIEAGWRMPPKRQKELGFK